MTPLAMPRVLDTFLVSQKIHIANVPGCAKRMGMWGLPPLFMSFLMTMAAIFGGRKSRRWNKFAVIGSRVRRQKRHLCTEKIVIPRRSRLVVGVACIVAGASLVEDGRHREAQDERSEKDKAFHCIPFPS